MGIKITVTEDNAEKIFMMSEKQCAKALTEIALQAQRHAKEYCPWRTGRLRNSITHRTDKSAAYIGTNVEYAPYVELGTSKQNAKPYLKPAVQNHKDEYIEIIKKNYGES